MTMDITQVLENLSSIIEKGFIQEEYDGLPIYLHPEAPFWFVPNQQAHEILRALMKSGDPRSVNGRPAGSPAHIAALARAITPPSPPPHQGRSHLPLKNLTELWFHVTDQCNLACRHCLFGCAPGSGGRLDPALFDAAAKQALDAGCRLFCFTGGEPFVYPGFVEKTGRLLEARDARIAVLTNGILIPRCMDELLRLDIERLHLQVSLDGPKEVNDAIRGPGTFDKVAEALALMRKEKIPCSLVMAVSEDNFETMADFIRVSKEMGVETVHFMWHFRRGSGDDLGPPSMGPFIERFQEAAAEAWRLDVVIDNIEAVKAQVFTHPGTRFDLGNGAWESLCVGPDGSIYPTPALVGFESMRAGHLDDGLTKVWRESTVLKKIRDTSLKDLSQAADHPWRLLLGGVDLDHCLHNPKMEDPYLPLYREIALFAIKEEAERLPMPKHPGLVLRMGDVTMECPSRDSVNFTHSNCLLSMGDGDTRTLVREFYAARADEVDETILNPVFYDPAEVEFIPEKGRVRSYGCGSPIKDADLRPGEVLVDLGCGSGVECFVAARLVGPEGRAIGVDMTDAMLDIAKQSQGPVEAVLGFANTTFLKGFLEEIPLEDETADVVVSNCVINLCRNKRRVFQEIFRVLKPGGRLVISDVVCEIDPPLAIRSDHKLTGECIGGAMVQDYLFSMLEVMGYSNATIVNRFPYRTVRNHPFYSLTFRAYRPDPKALERKDLLYGGPFKSLEMEDGLLLERGVRKSAALPADMDKEKLGEMGIFVLDAETGSVRNKDSEGSCCCAPPQEAAQASCCGLPKVEAQLEDFETGCLVCGAPLGYLDVPEEKTCSKCGGTAKADALCAQGHFVCDLCHKEDPVEVIRTVCSSSDETDMLRMASRIRSHPSFSVHGPEHHAMVPGVILATYRNLGGNVQPLQVMSAIDRGALTPGGACGFMGSCGAALGVGIAFALLLESNPLKGDSRTVSQRITAEVLKKIAETGASRCCRRECYIALKAAAELSGQYLPMKLVAEDDFTCDQHDLNRECLGSECPLYPF